MAYHLVGWRRSSNRSNSYTLTEAFGVFYLKVDVYAEHSGRTIHLKSYEKKFWNLAEANEYLKKL